MKILLDTNLILKFPKLLGLKIPDTEFLIIKDVIDELKVNSDNRGNQYEDMTDLIIKASNKGTIEIINTSLDIYNDHYNILDTPLLSRKKVTLLSAALGLKQNGDIVKIATTDKRLIKSARSNDIQVISDEEIENLIENFIDPEKTDSTIQSKIVSYERNEKKYLFYGILLGVTLTLLSILIYKNFQAIVYRINVWGTIILILLSGIALFIIREKQRLSYGIFELLVGMFSIIIVFQPSDFDFSKLILNSEFYIRLLGGLYIMVRGQDNMLYSIRDSKLGVYLKEKFGFRK